MNTITWASLGLLFLTYLHFGWALYEANYYFMISIFIIAFIWLIDLFFTLPLNQLKLPIIKWFRTDLGTFVMIVLISISTVIMMTWMHIFINVVIMVSATALARLELQASKFKNWQAFIILAVLSTVGLALGWVLNVV